MKFEVKPIGGNTSIDWLQFFDAIVANVDKLKIDMLIENMYSQSGVALDKPWRDKIHSYIGHIRIIVNNEPDVPVQIRETILKKLSAFEAEIERTRTRVQVFTDVFVSLCEGVNAGAEKLTPAVRVGERIIGALARLQGQPPILSLPSPDQFYLSPPEMLEPSSNPPRAPNSE